MGQKTEAAVVAFLLTAGHCLDGIPGPKTAMALAAALAARNVVDLTPGPARQSMSTIRLAVLAGRDARKLKAYKGSVGVWTVGIGHTAASGADPSFRSDGYHSRSLCHRCARHRQV
ncbi:hypothetical protein GCM10028812_53970 [Ancylobacter sonchi]